MLCEAAMKVWLGLWSHLGLMGWGTVWGGGSASKPL